jgi:hypothetical protein
MASAYGRTTTVELGGGGAIIVGAGVVTMVAGATAADGGFCGAVFSVHAARPKAAVTAASAGIIFIRYLRCETGRRCNFHKA